MHKTLLTSHNRKIAYQYNKGESKIGFIFFSGFCSDMTGTKAQYIFKWCKKNKYECTLFDYSGHGKSSEKFINTSFKEWIEDAAEVLNKVPTKPQILIGSSMGGWIALKIGLMNPLKIKGVVTIAAAPDFTKKLWQKELNQEQKNEIKTMGYTNIPSEFDPNGYIITKKIIKEGNKNLILTTKNMFSFPLKLIHGDQDKAVSWKESLKIFNKSNNALSELIILKNGDHRLSDKKQLNKIISVIQSLLEDCNVSHS
ncbi:MAG: alpha/beta hydrolase [Pelagibacterales bacterium]|nr:alpha/beta hydrolase [Pelagibacterales bacterium]PPR16723.1 MAG: 2-succinyl-6-hydroxy-2,4-cyclohexadiene-1-carboxylate synthase [Alphaproteobacteria bacterium MarineAlpha9_Bin3]|tara:strand:- start:53 stop:817 length:765 start_codon:yes stop_codon:yes gene_type:complete